MYLFMTREAFVAAVANALCACRFVQSREYGFTFAENVRGSMGLNCHPRQEVSVDCRVLWLTLFKLLERAEPTSFSEPYSNLARTMLGEVIRASVGTSVSASEASARHTERYSKRTPAYTRRPLARIRRARGRRGMR